MTGPERELHPLERGMLADLHAASVMTTGQLWRLRFPGTGIANCRLRLERLVRRGLVRRIARGRGLDACWCLSADGCAALGVTPPPAGTPRADEVDDGPQLRSLIFQAECYVQGKLVERVRGLDLLLPRPPGRAAPRISGGGPAATPSPTSS